MDMRLKPKHHLVIAVGVLIVAVLTTGLLIKFNGLPVSAPRLTDTTKSPVVSAIDKKLASLSTSDKVALLFMFHTPGTDPAVLKDFVDRYHPGGMILMDDNIPANESDTLALSQAIYGDDKSFPRLVATDEEGGTVTRLPSDTYDSAANLDQKPPSATFTAFDQRAKLLHALGINLNFGIVADVTSDPNSFIYPRVLATTPSAAADRVEQAVKGEKGQVLSTLKHFPGHGETDLNSHVTIPKTNINFSQWQQKDAIPFERGIQAGANVVMLGQLIYSAVDSQPASMSAKWYSILRNDLKFQGLTVTDDMIMLLHSGDPAYIDPVKNAVAAINAGADLVLYVTNHGANTQVDPAALLNGVVTAVNNGEISQTTLDSAVKQVLTAQQLAGK